MNNITSPLNFRVCRWTGFAPLGSIFLFAVAIILSVLHSAASSADAQIVPPDEDFLFYEDKQKKDTEKQRRTELRERRKKLSEKARAGLPFDISGMNMDFNSAEQSIVADGGVVLSYGAGIAEARQGKFFVESREAELNEDVRISDLFGNIVADKAKLDLRTGYGELHNAEMFFEEGGYRIDANEVIRYPGEEYEFDEVELTTCACPEGDDCMPWKVRADRSKVTRNGYGRLWGGTLSFYDVPVFYFPYLVYPAKTDRQSGLLPMRFGTGRRSGLSLEVPLFLAIDHSTDATLTGIYESKIRTGVDSEFRKIFSEQNSLSMGIIYLDETARGGDLLGTNVDGLADPTIDENRSAGYYNQYIQGTVFDRAFQVIVDGKYVSDNVFIREYEKNEIGEANSRYVTSRALGRVSPVDSISTELVAEYNRSLVSEQDFVFQSYPRFLVSGLHSFRPLPQNRFGNRIALSSNVDVSNYQRTEGFDGVRAEVFERVRYPFRIRNFVRGDVEGNVRATAYELDNLDLFETSLDPENPEETITTVTPLEKSTNRVVPGMLVNLSTVFEKVINVEQDSWTKTFAELGTFGRYHELMRLKHTIQPKLSYQFTPSINQDENPRFNSYDKLERRNRMTYGVATSLFSRFDRRNPFLYGIEEATPELEDFEELESGGLVDEFGTFGVPFGEEGEDFFHTARSGIKKELIRVGVSQTADIDREWRGAEGPSFSDLSADAMFLPNDHFRLRTQADINTSESDFSAYTIETQMLDKRGDELRARFRFNESGIRQLESSVEFGITEFIRLGYYARYDALESEFIENKFGVRLKSECRCWVLDIDVADQLNPDETKIAFNLTLVGLGELGNTFFSDDRQQGN